MKFEVAAFFWNLGLICWWRYLRWSISKDRGCVHRETSYVLFGNTLVVGKKTFKALSRYPHRLTNDFVAGDAIYPLTRYELVHSPICNARTGW